MQKPIKNTSELKPQSPLPFPPKPSHHLHTSNELQKQTENAHDVSNKTTKSKYRIKGNFKTFYSLLFGSLLAFLFLFVEGCDCDSGVIQGQTLRLQFIQPTPGPVAARFPIEVRSSDPLNTQYIQVFITSRPQRGQPSKEWMIAELHSDPFQFKWNSFVVPDGFYQIQAVGYDLRGVESKSKKQLIQVLNAPPQMWFVNCRDGQFIRGIYALVVSLTRQETHLLNPPKLYIDNKHGSKTQDKRAPYRFHISTLGYPEGKQLNLSAVGSDVKNNQRRITCRPKVDNTPPKLQFIEPRRKNGLYGRKFQAQFSAQDRFGVREVHLWIDGSPCRSHKAKTKNNSNAANPCPKREQQWISTKAPLFTIDITLPDTYQSEKPILLTARAVDLAGNLSAPVQRKIRVDPIPPEIFIRSPGKGLMLEGSGLFIARVTDNDQLKKVTYQIKSQGKVLTLKTYNLLQSEASGRVKLDHLEKQLGYGRKFFIVTATDRSGNRSVVSRAFSVGCVDTTDCPLGKVCHRSKCLIPAKLNQLCNARLPCEIGTQCVPGEAPLCSLKKRTYCRKQCNPGNKFVSADKCSKGFYCDRKARVCLPGDGCTPLRDGCGAGKQCVPVDADSGICIPLGRIAQGQSCGESCSANNNCQNGHWCVHLLNLGRTACLRVCIIGGQVSCPQGERCAPLAWVFGGGQLQYGVCE